MLGNMMDKLQQMQEEMNASKEKLAQLTIMETDADKLVNVTVSGNSRIKDIKLNQELLNEDIEMIEDLLTTTLNRALEKAAAASEKEMANSAKGILPNLPGF